MPEGEIYFPTTQDIRSHRASRTKKRKAAAAIESRAKEIVSPEQLTEFAFEIARTKFKSGQRRMEFIIEVPTDNFRLWASHSGIGSADWDQLDRRAARIAIARTVRRQLGPYKAAGVFAKIDTGCSLNQRFCFKIQFTVIV